MRAPLVCGLALTATMLVGCVQAYRTRPGALQPALANVAPAERTLLWQRATGVLLDQGYVPQVLNEAAGYISARRREDLAEDALAGTMTTVVISPEGVLRVEVSGTGFYRSEQDFLDAVRTRQAQMMQAILGARPQAK